MSTVGRTTGGAAQKFTAPDRSLPFPKSGRSEPINVCRRGWARVGCPVIASCNALTTATEDTSPASVSARYCCCVGEKGRLLFDRHVHQGCGCGQVFSTTLAMSVDSVSKVLATRHSSPCDAITFPSLVQPEVPKLMPNVWLPNVPLVVAIMTWGAIFSASCNQTICQLLQSASRPVVWIHREGYCRIEDQSTDLQAREVPFVSSALVLRCLCYGKTVSGFLCAISTLAVFFTLSIEAPVFVQEEETGGADRGICVRLSLDNKGEQRV